MKGSLSCFFSKNYGKVVENFFPDGKFSVCTFFLLNRKGRERRAEDEEEINKQLAQLFGYKKVLYGIQKTKSKICLESVKSMFPIYLKKERRIRTHTSLGGLETRKSSRDEEATASSSTSKKGPS